MIRVSVSGIPELQRALERMNPGQNRRILRNGLIIAALEIQKNAADKQIVAGGRGKKNATPPLPDRLTSRTGTLRRSIKVDRGPLPFAIEIGTDLTYGAVHEFGNQTHPKRPFMQPALDAITPKFGKIFLAQWKKEAQL